MSFLILFMMFVDASCWYWQVVYAPWDCCCTNCGCALSIKNVTAGVSFTCDNRYFGDVCYEKTKGCYNLFNQVKVGGEHDTINVDDNNMTRWPCSSRFVSGSSPCGANCYQDRDGNGSEIQKCVASCDIQNHIANASSGRCDPKECSSRKPPCRYGGNTSCYEQVSNGGDDGIYKGSGVYNNTCASSCNSRHFTPLEILDRCLRLECSERKNISSETYPCASADCFQQIDVWSNTQLESCNRSCPEDSSPESGKCVVIDCSLPANKIKLFCESKACEKNPSVAVCCNIRNKNEEVCDQYCESHPGQCSCAVAWTFSQCCGNCTQDKGYEGCDPSTEINCKLYCGKGSYYTDDKCAHYWCKEYPGTDSCCVNVPNATASANDCDDYCENYYDPVGPDAERCAEHKCNSTIAWFQRDKCICDLHPASTACDVYCKYPFFNYIKCARSFQNNDEYLCKYLELAASCERFCGSNQSCLCEYVDVSYCESTVCGVVGKEEECECKYRDSANKTWACLKYCAGLLGPSRDYVEYYKCMCEYTSDASDCSHVCLSKSNFFEQLECNCTTTTGLLTDEQRMQNCTALCDLVPQDTSRTKDLCECYYVKGEDYLQNCTMYCQTFSWNGGDDRQQEQGNCECIHENDLAACQEECDRDFTTDDITKLLCKCNNGDEESCEAYCSDRYPGRDDDPKNSRLWNCMCIVANASSTCSRYCNDSTKIDNEEQKKEADYYCVRFCNALGPEWNETNPTEIERLERVKSTCFCDRLKKDEDCEFGCEWIQEGYADPEDYLRCGRYCNSLLWPEQIAACQCDYGVDIKLCRSFCVGSSFSSTRCNEFCKNQSFENETLLCRCYFDLDMNACVEYCNSKESESESAKLKCLCDLGIKENCEKSCAAFGDEGKAMEKARCLCRHQVDKNACFDYCDLAFAGFDDSHIMQERCKCDYGLGEGYCDRYVATFEDRDLKLYACQQRNDTQACFDYCNDYAAVEGKKDLYKCMCEIYGDLNYCPMYCNSLNVSDAELLRCKCIHYFDNPSCIQYCATVPSGPEHDECECTLVTPEENSGPTSSQRQACINYCRSKPSYMERVKCACDSGLDANRCSEEAAMKPKDLQSTIYKERCELSWNGDEHEWDCRNYCNLLQLEGITTADLTPRQQLLQCYCDVVKSRESCVEFCTSKDSEEGAKYHECMCEHGKRKQSCITMCESNDTNIINECNCKASGFYPPGLDYCSGFCTAKYNNGTGDEGLLYHSCLSTYDKCAYKAYCDNFTDGSMKEFCLCFHEPDSTHCVSYCAVLAKENTTGDFPIVEMCQCVWDENNTACNVFCNPNYYADYLCYRSCDTFTTVLEYQQCLCTAGVSDRACASVCDEFFAAEDMESYYECRCIHNLDLLSCRIFCASLPTIEEQQACEDSRVNLGFGNITGKGLYVDDYDVEESYMPSIVVVIDNDSNVTSNATNDSISNDTGAKLTKAEHIRRNNEKKAAIVVNVAIVVIIVCAVVAIALALTIAVLLYIRNTKRRKKAEKEAEVWRKSFQRISVSVSRKNNSTNSDSANNATATNRIFGSESSAAQQSTSEVDEAANLIVSLAADPACTLAQFCKEFQNTIGSEPTSDQCSAFMKERQKIAKYS